MYLARTKSVQNGKQYQCVLLRESYREAGKVKNRTIANISGGKPEEIEAIELALKCKGNLDALRRAAGDKLEIEEGLSMGALWAVLEVARRLGIESALGTSRQGKLALWQVLARVLGQGSRLSAVRLAQVHAACDALGMDEGFCGDDLYANLSWLEKAQDGIEDRLFRQRWKAEKPGLFLYDVTSSYLEGECNELAAWGYNRDKKRGKRQVVAGLLCDPQGVPVSVELFQGNTQDVGTFASQVRKASERFGCMRVTFVGDRGMIKSQGRKELAKQQMSFITALTRPQIKKLVSRGAVQLDLFEDALCVAEGGGVRYVLRRNPRRAAEMAASRAGKRQAAEEAARKASDYLAGHPKASPETALAKVAARIRQLGAQGWLEAKAQERRVTVAADEEAMARDAQLDGCYALVSDVPAGEMTGQQIHDRYKDLADVEWAFRTMKTAHLELRPIHVRTKGHTRAHALVVMLAYLIVQELDRLWAGQGVKAAEGLASLATLSTMTVRHGGAPSGALMVARPRELSRRLLDAAGVRLPEALPSRGLSVVTRKKLREKA